MSQKEEDASKIIADATCTRCGCLCDDIELRVEGSRITDAKRACPLGTEWFLDHRVEERPACVIDGKPVSLETGMDRAAEILKAAKNPLVYGLSNTAVESQRIAVSIADWIGANLDTTSSIGQGPATLAFQNVGEVTCSLGEVRNRADFVMFWGSDPETSHPRHFGKYSLAPKGMFLPNGREDRYCVVVDVRETESAKAADLFIQVKPDSDFEALWTLRALANDVDLDPEAVLAQTGQPITEWQNLMERMKSSNYGVIFFGMGLTGTRGKHANNEAMLTLTRDMNRHTRFSCKPNRGQGNITGADNVVSWRTGFPFGVNLGRGFPRFNPGEYTAPELLARGEADAALVVASDPMQDFGAPACQHLKSIPLISIDPKETATTRAAEVAFYVSTYGINTPGTVYRMDDVSIPLRPALESPLPSEFEILHGIEQRVR